MQATYLNILYELVVCIHCQFFFPVIFYHILQISQVLSRDIGNGILLDNIFSFLAAPTTRHQLASPLFPQPPLYRLPRETELRAGLGVP